MFEYGILRISFTKSKIQTFKTFLQILLKKKKKKKTFLEIEFALLLEIIELNILSISVKNSSVQHYFYQ